MSNPTPESAAIRAELAEIRGGLRHALTELARASERPYYDAERDRRDATAYYQPIRGRRSRQRLYEALQRLVTDTHARRPPYNPARELYPWVDLVEVAPRPRVRSIYSGQLFDARAFIEADQRILQERERVQRLLEEQPSIQGFALRQQLAALERALPFNCEHVVPQSWFDKREPMRGDLHHLFACESACNSFRGNTPYFDFPDFQRVVREHCGKREMATDDDAPGFEPAAGKGEIARATLYFLLRYPGEIHVTGKEFRKGRIALLLDWHARHPVTRYEQHRNQAIFERQGNRNPLIDRPQWATKIDFTLGFG